MPRAVRGSRARHQYRDRPRAHVRALAAATDAFLDACAVPVFAQWEVAEFLVGRIGPAVASIDPEIGPDGELVYLSTAGVIAQADAKARAMGVELGVVGVIGFADHVMRCVRPRSHGPNHDSLSRLRTCRGIWPIRAVSACKCRRGSVIVGR